MTNVSPWIIRTLTFPQFASLYGTVHCPFSPWELLQTSPVHPNHVIWYALSHIILLYLPQNSHHTYLLWLFHGHSELYCHATSTASVWWLEHLLSYCFAWSCSWHRIYGKATMHSLSYISLLIHCPSRYTAGGIHIESYLVLVSSCNHWVVNK